LSAHVNHPVDAGASTQNTASGIGKTATIESSLRCGGITPVGFGIAHGVQIPNGDMNPMPGVFAACFNESHSVIWLCGQPVGENTTGTTRANNESVCLNGFSH